MLKKILCIVTILILLFQSMGTVHATTLRLKVTIGATPFLQSGIYHTPSNVTSGNMNISASIDDGGKILKVLVDKSLDKGIHWTKIANPFTPNRPNFNEDIEWNGAHLYRVIVKGTDTEQMITIDVKTYTPATHPIRYQTYGMTVISVNGEKLDPPKEVRLINGDTIDPDDKHIWEWPEIKPNGGLYTFVGSGIIQVYKLDKYGDQTILNTFHLSANEYGTYYGPPKSTGQLRLLQESQGWTESVRDVDFPSRCSMTLQYLGPITGRIVIERKELLSDGTTRPYGSAIPFKDTLIDPWETSQQDINLSDYSVNGNKYNLSTPTGYKLHSSSTVQNGREGVNSDGSVNINNINWGTPQTLTKSSFQVRQTFAEPHIKVTLVYAQDPPTAGRFGIDAKPDSVQIVHTDKIRSTASVSVEMKQSAESLAKWKEYITGKTLQLSVTLSRTPQNNDPASTSSITTASGYPASGTFVNISRDQLLSYFEKGKTIVYNDIINYSPIAEGQTLKFDYAAVVKLKVDAETFTLTPNSGTDSVSFYSPMGVITKPSCWSEIKEGSPGNETFEAMAGVPTTKSLYFASGGSEFIVDAEVQYVQDTEITRTYKSFFSAVDSEFKAGDTAPSQTIGGQTVDLHNGGTYTKTWTGSIPNNATSTTASGTGSVTATCSAVPDYTAYNDAKAKAQEYITTVSGTTLSFTSASDKQKREHDGWGAHISIDSKNPPQDTSVTSTSYHSETRGTPPNQSTVQVGDPVTATASPGGAGNFTITVTFTVPAHIICGPCCTHVLPLVQDTWTQKIKFDHMKINSVHVWKIDQAAVNGMTDITGTDEIKATIVAGEPNIFYNRSATNKSVDGRLRYTVETDQHDTVVWDEGPRSNKEDGQADNGVSHGNGHASSWATGIIYTNGGYTNTKDYHVSSSDAKDKASIEWQKFNERRTTQNIATVVSDMLILQTSSGDQSVLYFARDSESKQTQENFPKVSATREEMWDNNPLSAAKWSEDHINIGSYNGNFAAPASKYTGTGDHSLVATVFDTKPAGLNRPPRPGTGLRLVRTGIDIIDTLPNGEYITGDASVFYKLILNYGASVSPYSTAYNTRFGDAGDEKASPYSNNHTKVNNIVIHDPVSTEAAVVMPLPPDRDQRTPETKVLGGNLQPAEVEYESMLKANPPKQNLLYNGDAELTSSDGGISGWTRGEWGASGVYTHARRTNDPTWTIAGTGSFEIRSNKNEPAGSSASYYMDMTGIPMNNRYTLSGKIAAHRCTVTLELSFFDPSGALISSIQAGITNNNPVPLDVSYPFTPPANTYRMRVELRKGVTTSGTTDSYLFADNLSLTNNDVNTWIALSDPIYDTIAIPNPDYVPSQQAVAQNFNYTGSYQTYTAPYTGTYTFEVWGAQGGTATYKNLGGQGGLGGYSKGTYNLTSGQTVYIYVGGSGSDNGTGGWNGGGNSAYGTGSGGGATDIRIGGQTLSDRVIVAGGGGGGGAGATGGYGGGTYGFGGTSTSEVTGGSGANQFSGYALGLGGPCSGNGNAGGGGYYGGYGSQSHGCPNPDAGGGGGSGYIGGVTNATMSSGVRTGNGYAKITAPAGPPVGGPTITVQVLAANQPSPVPPDDWYELVARTTSPSAQVSVPDVGTVSAGTFINLDHPFYVSFPNLGNFRGDSAWGIAGTTAQRGKGFIDGMDTTEYTKSKSVTFGFNVLYNGTVYTAGQEIDLPVEEQLFEFYCPLANYEALSAPVTFKAIAINGSVMDNTNMTNRLRDASMSAKHSALKNANVDIVGRIGNLTIEDTGDFRFSNFFKLPVAANEWIVPNVVKKVDPRAPNKIIGSGFDIKGNPVGEGTDYLNTYGHLEYLQQPPVDFPLSPEKNNIPALQRQPMRPGYNVYASIQTIGNYYTNLQVKMYYYHLNLTTKAITPVDVYMSVNNSYKPINLFDEPGRDLSGLYPYKYNLNWEEEKDRRNYSDMEDMITKMASLAYGLSYPSGNNCIIGTAQVLQLGSGCRTFIGNSSTYGQYKNPGEVLPLSLFNVQAQRWHFTYGLPSSAVFVPKGTVQPTQAIIDSMCNNKSVIIAAAEIKVTGNPYVLQYSHMEGNSDIVINGVHYPTTSIPQTVLSVYSANKSSADDLSVTGTH